MTPREFERYRQDFYIRNVAIDNIGTRPVDSIEFANITEITQKSFGLFCNGECIQRFTSIEEAKAQKNDFFTHEPNWAKTQSWRIIRLDNKKDFTYSEKPS